MLRIWLLMIAFCTANVWAESLPSSQDAKYQGIEITVNINQASAEELADLLKGVGSKKAQAIVDYRNEHGQFKHADELANVKGIGPAIVEENQQRIKL